MHDATHFNWLPTSVTRVGHRQQPRLANHDFSSADPLSVLLSFCRPL
jgi:hypothetical protein